MSLLVNYENSDNSDSDDDDNIIIANLNQNKINLNHEPKIYEVNKDKINKLNYFESLKNDNGDLEFGKSPSSNNYVDSENKVQIDVSLLDIFSKLPAPIMDADIIEPEMIILPSKSEIELREKPPEKKKIIINLPTIADSDSDSENENGPISKKIKKDGKCDLFNLLPAPKSSATRELNRSLIPHSVSFKPKISTIPNKSQSLKSNDSVQDFISKPDISSLKDSMPTNIRTSNELTINSINSSSSTFLSNCYSDSENEESSDNYFLIDNTGKNRLLSNKNYPSYFSNSETDHLAKNLNYLDSITGNYNSCSSTTNDSTNALLINNDSLLNESQTLISPNMLGAMIGPSNKSEYDYDTNLSKFSQNINVPMEYSNLEANVNKKDLEAPRSRDFADFETAEIIEARIDDWMSGYEVQKMKDLTQEQSRISYSKKHNKDMPTMQQKRKHQITYLAYEAKERELELKNQWAENRFTKKQTQSKYGF